MNKSESKFYSLRVMKVPTFYEGQKYETCPGMRLHLLFVLQSHHSRGEKMFYFTVLIQYIFSPQVRFNYIIITQELIQPNMLDRIVKVKT